MSKCSLTVWLTPRGKYLGPTLYSSLAVTRNGYTHIRDIIPVINRLQAQQKALLTIFTTLNTIILDVITIKRLLLTHPLLFSLLL